MNPTAFIIRPLEGLQPLDAPEIFDNWVSAALQLKVLCGRNPSPRHYNKIEVFITYAGGNWERRRFDAERGAESILTDLDTFRANTLLWQRYPPRRLSTGAVAGRAS